jgi:hypothetical protein
MASTSNYALHLLAALKTEVEKVAAIEGTMLNRFINVAVTEKLAVLCTAGYFRERATPADLEAFDHLLATTGEEPPRPEDEIVEFPQSRVALAISDTASAYRPVAPVREGRDHLVDYAARGHRPSMNTIRRGNATCCVPSTRWATRKL